MQCLAFPTSLSFQLNAIANRAAGKGYENEDHYSNIKFQFISIENIHVMRNSQQKMLYGNDQRSQSFILSKDISRSLGSSTDSLFCRKSWRDINHFHRNVHSYDMPQISVANWRNSLATGETKPVPSS